MFKKIKENKFIIFIILLPFFCFISRKLSKPLYLNPFKDLKDNSFFGKASLHLKNNSTIKEIVNISEYNNVRLFIETKYNKIILYFTFSNYYYYDIFNISFAITLNLNKSQLHTDNNSSIWYLDKFENNSNIIKIKDNKGIINYFTKKINIPLNEISFKDIISNQTIQCNLIFDDFDLSMTLQKEKFTYKFYYLLECAINVFVFSVIYNYNYFENNYQNINNLFIYIIWEKIYPSSIYQLMNLIKVGIPIFKIIKFYTHLLIYGEFLLSISNIITIGFTIFILCCLIVFVILFFDIENNYHYCFSNEIINNTIVIKEKGGKSKNLSFLLFLFSSSITFIYSSSQYIYNQFFPLIIALMTTILHHLNQREVMCTRDKQFCIKYYWYNTLIYLYFLFIYNIGAFYRIKPQYSVFPFILIFILYQILKYIIKNEYKLNSTMKKDFEKLKKLEKEVCSICLKDFIYDKNKVGKFFCKVSEDENIHETICNHYFHEKCLFNWRKRRNICPNCKTPLPIPDYYYFYDQTPCIYNPSI